MSEPDWRPRLRADVQRETVDGRLLLVDPVWARRVPAGALTAALVARLDGSRGVAALVAEVAHATQEPEPEARAALRNLLLLGLLEGTHTQALEQARAAPSREPRVLPQARFGCVASGQCCHVYRPGPLTDPDVARLETHAEALRAAYPDLPAAWVEYHPGDGGPLRRYLARREGRCVFLLPDRRCGVHAVVGREAKPEACKLFPFDLVRTLDGLRVFDVSQCSAFAVTSQQGEPHARYAEEVRRLAPAAPRLFHPLVLLEPGLPCDYSAVLALEVRLGELAVLPTAARVPRCAALAAAFVERLRACPLEAGEPWRSVEALLLEDRADALPPLEVAEPGDWARAVVAVTEALEGACAAGDEPDAPLVEAFQEGLGVLRALAAERAGLAASPLPEVLRRAASLEAPQALLDRVLGASLANRVFGARFLVQGQLRAGVASLALHELLAVTIARVRAATAGAPALREQDLSAGHWITSLALARPRLAGALVSAQGKAWVLASESVAGLSGGLAGP